MENEIAREQDDGMMKEIRDLLKHLKEIRNPAAVSTSTVEGGDATHASNTAFKLKTDETDENDISFQRIHNLDSHITNGDTQASLGEQARSESH